MIESESRSVLESAGGKWFLNTRFLLLATPLIVSLSLLSAGASRQNDFLSGNDFLRFYLELFVANLIAIGCCAAFVMVFARTLFAKRETKHLPLWVVLSFSAAVGALKGVSTGIMMWVFQIENDLLLSIASRFWQTAILGLWLLPALALLAHRLEQLQIQRDVLVAERVSFLLQSTNSSALTKAKDALREFSEFARNKLAKETLADDSPDGSKNYAAAIRKLVADDLRPLSHRIWGQENRKYSNFSIAETSRRALSKFSAGSTLVAVAYVITSIPSVARYMSVDQAFFRSLVAGLTIYLVLRMAAVFKPTNFLFASVWFLLVTLLASAIGFYSGDFLFGQTEGYRIMESILATWIWVAQLAFVSSFLLDLRRGQKSLSSEVAASFGTASIDKAARFSQARLQNRDFANFLHGQVQNKLLGIALSLERGHSPAEELEEALRSVDEVLMSVESEFESLNSGNLTEGMNRQRLQWQGFVDIRSSVDAAAEGLPIRDRILTLQVIDEAIANAVRHGLSKSIQIELSVQDGRPCIEVTDDGIGPRNGKSGLGSAFFESLSAGNWSLDQLPNGGSKLTVNF
jgi:two-component sensor histidine kinase